jgi:hypothetical protein
MLPLHVPLLNLLSYRRFHAVASAVRFFPLGMAGVEKDPQAHWTNDRF